MIRVVFVLCLLSLVTSCNTNSLTNLRLSQQRNRWLDHNISAYDYTFRLYCNCPKEMMRPARVLVRNDIVTSARYLDTGEFVREPSVFARYSTVSDMFTEIEAMMGKNVPVQVRYNPLLGNPEFLVLGFVDTTSQTDWWSLNIENLLIIH